MTSNSQENKELNNKVEKEKKMKLNEENTEIVTANIENFEGEEAKKIIEQVNINNKKIEEISNLNKNLLTKRQDILYDKIEEILEDSKLNNDYYLERINDSECAIFNNYPSEFIEPIKAISGSITDMLVIFELIRRK